MIERGVNFVREPKTESYGIVAVFEDLCGNLWDLLQLNSDHSDLGLRDRQLLVKVLNSEEDGS